MEMMLIVLGLAEDDRNEDIGLLLHCGDIWTKSEQN